MLLRKAVVSDARGIAEVHVSSWRGAYEKIMPASLLSSLRVATREQFWRERISLGATTTVVAEEGGVILAWLAFGPCRDPDASGDELEVYGIYVAPNHWRRGIGKQLWMDALGAMRSSSAACVYVWVLEANQQARLFYVRMGAELDGSRKAVDRGGVLLPEVRYRCPISS